MNKQNYRNKIHKNIYFHTQYILNQTLKKTSNHFKVKKYNNDFKIIIDEN